VVSPPHTGDDLSNTLIIKCCALRSDPNVVLVPPLLTDHRSCNNLVLDSRPGTSTTMALGSGDKGNDGESFHHPLGPHHCDVRDDLHNSYKMVVEQVWLASLHLDGVVEWYYALEQDYRMVLWAHFTEFVNLHFGPRSAPTLTHDKITYLQQHTNLGSCEVIHRKKPRG
jgi:hypothetical protein